MAGIVTGARGDSHRELRPGCAAAGPLPAILPAGRAGWRLTMRRAPLFHASMRHRVAAPVARRASVAALLGLGLLAGAGCTPGTAGQAALAEAKATLTAERIVFSPAQVHLPAGTPAVLWLDNRDNLIPHDVQVQAADGTVIATGDRVTGPARTPLALPPLAAGTYRLTCTIHPAMAAELVVGP